MDVYKYQIWTGVERQGRFIKPCKRGNVNPTDVVFLDDLGINLKPARELGMKTIKVIQPMDALSELNTYLDINLD